MADAGGPYTTDVQTHTFTQACLDEAGSLGRRGRRWDRGRFEHLRNDPTIEPVGEPLPPVATIDLRIGDACLSLFSTIAQFGTAEDLALAELRIELFFPADEPTRLFLESLT